MTNEELVARLEAKIDAQGAALEALGNRVEANASLIRQLDRRIMDQFEYLILEIHRIEDAKPREEREEKRA